MRGCSPQDPGSTPGSRTTIMIVDPAIKEWQGHLVMAWLYSQKTLGKIGRIEVKDLELHTYTKETIQSMFMTGMSIVLEIDKDDPILRRYT